jgi:hypothetical protein
MTSNLQKALDWIIPILRQQAIAFQITGGLAAHLYGSTRDVNDIDIDVEASSIEKLRPLIEAFIVAPPERYMDSTWWIYGATLNFHGQLIDLTEKSEPYVRDKATGVWIELAMNFDTVTFVSAFGHTLPTQDPHDLISYKRRIAYDEHKHLKDIAAVESYIHRTTDSL